MASLQSSNFLPCSVPLIDILFYIVSLIGILPCIVPFLVFCLIQLFLIGIFTLYYPLTPIPPLTFPSNQYLTLRSLPLTGMLPLDWILPLIVIHCLPALYWFIFFIIVTNVSNKRYKVPEIYVSCR